VLSQLDKAAVILDFSHVSGIDAAGLGLLLELRKHSLTKHIEFKIMNVTPLIRQVFAITCLDSIFQITAEANAPIVRGRVATSLRLPACA
jgi:anti-anti-sigma factor